MYDELVKRLRDAAQWADKGFVITPSICLEAANAIEELENKLNLWRQGKINRWIPIESRPMDEEERQYYSEHFGYDLTDDEAIIYCCQLPEDGEEVLVCNKWGHVWIDTFDNDPDYGIGFETNGDMDGLVAWMPKPKPYKPPKEEK